MAYDVIDIPASPETYSAGRASVDYVVIHYTGGAGGAVANGRYFAGGNRNASAHYFVDDGCIVRSVPEGDTAWHAGNFWFNRRSVGVEVCSDGEDFTPGELARLRWLVGDLMARHGVPAARVCRHYDCYDLGACDGAEGAWVDPHKDCPAPYVSGDPDGSKWAALWAYVTGGAGDAPASDGEPEAGEAVCGVPAETYASWVRDVQREVTDSLSRYGQPGCEVDGVYGPATRAACVRLLQCGLNSGRGAGLDVDGVAGPATLAALGEHPVGVGYSDHGDDVYAVKCGLVIQGWDIDLTSWDWDDACDAACRGHQRAHGLAPDGVVGAGTLPTLLP